MPLYRGGVYAAAELSARTSGLLVLTRDTWNESGLQTVVVAPVGPVSEPEGLPTPLVDLAGNPAQVRLGDALEFPKFALGALVGLLRPNDLARVENGLCDLLLLRELCANPPRAPRPRAVSHPQWGEIYYLLGEEFEGERKRRVVVSHDNWNRTGRALAVRTTTSPRRGGPGFPAIQRSRVVAVCGSLTSYTRQRFSQQRPDPPRLFLPDMAAIARGLADMLELEDALLR